MKLAKSIFTVLPQSLPPVYRPPLGNANFITPSNFTISAIDPSLAKI